MNIAHNVYIYQKGKTIAFLLSWLTGLLLGGLLSLSSTFDFPLMRICCMHYVSIVHLLVSAVIPLALSFVSVFLGIPCFIHLLAFVKAFSFSYALFLVIQIYGTAGWMIGALVFFPDIAFLVPLFCYWRKYVPGGKLALFKNTLLCAFTMLFITLAYNIFVVPLSAQLIK